MEKLLRLSEVAELLRISEVTAKIWASKRKFPVVKVGRLCRVSYSSLLAWIERREETGRDEVTSSQTKKNRRPKSHTFEKYVQKLRRGEE